MEFLLFNGFGGFDWWFWNLGLMFDLASACSGLEFVVWWF